MYEQAATPPARKLLVPIVVGTRPEAIKLVPIILAMRESEHYEPIVVSTGQHSRMVEYIFELAEIRPDVTLWAGARRANLNERVSSVMRRFEDFCVERFEIDPEGHPSVEDRLEGRIPAAVLVHGDTSSAMAAALSAFHMRIPVMHVEAGLRTGGVNLTPFPEELNRQVISTIAAMHFAPTSANLQNLVRENIPVRLGARVEQAAYLLMPFWQGIVGVGLLAAVILAILGTAPFWGGGPTWQLGFFYLLAFGGTTLGCVAARSRSGPAGWLRGLLIAQVYTPYTWFLWPVLLRSSVRQLLGSGSWAKTEREPLVGAAAPR